MGLTLRMWVASLLLLTHLVHRALCWGDDGHYAVCKIAQSYFEEETLAAVKKLLPAYADGELAAVCSWPDEIKRLPEWKWTAALHFADTPDYKCNYYYSRDCPKDWCVTGAIFNYTNQLMPDSENSLNIVHYNLTEALIFLSHYMGDIHQPLHEGFLGDLGGNRVKVNWYNQETNLHRVWDDMIIESALEKYYNSSLLVMIHALQEKLKNGWSNNVPSWGSCPRHQTACPNRYASESVDLACKYAYKDATAGTTLGDYYFLSRLNIVEKRIAQGGIRLAATLNRIFSLNRSSLQHETKTLMSVCYGSCDGLVCLYDRNFGVVMANPATRWHRSFPLAKIQKLLIYWSRQGIDLSSELKLGFGKDKHISIYKPVFFI